MTIQTLINVSKILRESHPDVVKIFTNGGCYEYFRALNFIAPDLEPYYIGSQSHVMGRLGNTLIDINGVHTLSPVDRTATPMDYEPRLLQEAATWREEAWK